MSEDSLTVHANPDIFFQELSKFVYAGGSRALTLWPPHRYATWHFAASTRTAYFHAFFATSQC